MLIRGVNQHAIDEQRERTAHVLPNQTTQVVNCRAGAKLVRATGLVRSGRSEGHVVHFSVG